MDAIFYLGTMSNPGKPGLCPRSGDFWPEAPFVLIEAKLALFCVQWLFLWLWAWLDEEEAEQLECEVTLEAADVVYSLATWDKEAVLRDGSCLRIVAAETISEEHIRSVRFNVSGRESEIPICEDLEPSLQEYPLAVRIPIVIID